MPEPLADEAAPVEVASSEVVFDGYIWDVRRESFEYGERPRMQELAAAVHLSQSALSRTVGRLEKDGLVGRAMCPEDRRGVAVCLTDEGRERYEAARPTHRQVLAETLTPSQPQPA